MKLSLAEFDHSPCFWTPSRQANLDALHNISLLLSKYLPKINQIEKMDLNRIFRALLSSSPNPKSSSTTDECYLGNTSTPQSLPMGNHGVEGLMPLLGVAQFMSFSRTFLLVNQVMNYLDINPTTLVAALGFLWCIWHSMGQLWSFFWHGLLLKYATASIFVSS